MSDTNETAVIPVAQTPHQVGLDSAKDLVVGGMALAPLAPAVEWASGFTSHPMTLEQSVAVLGVAYLVAAASSYIMGRIRGARS